MKKVHCYTNLSMCDRGLRNGLRSAGQDDVWALYRSYGAHAGGGAGRSRRHIL